MRFCLSLLGEPSISWPGTNGMTILIYVWLKCDRCGGVSETGWTNLVDAAKSTCRDVKLTAEKAGWMEINHGWSPRRHYCVTCLDKPMVSVDRSASQC